MSLELPENCELVEDVVERVQAKDMVYDEEDLEWYEATRWHIGHYVSKFPAVARPSLAPSKPVTPTVKVLRRRR